MTHTARWTVEIFLFEEGDVTRAEAVLHTGEADVARGNGTARRNPKDAPVPQIGDELAAARALSDLSHRVFDVAVADIEAQVGARVHLQP